MKMLDATKPQPVKYCIDLWLRDEQMKLSIARFPGRIQPVEPPIDEPAAIACFGPSLKDTWERIRDFKTVFSCSGSHKFLVERGIIPTYHVEVDPRAHKVELIGPPHPNVTYLIASCCHPKVFDHLQGFNVKLWHVFANGENGKTFPEIFPRNEWAITGGSSVGLRCLTLARFLGHTHQHIFGMDGSFQTGDKHAASHPNQQKEEYEVPHGGRTFLSTPSFLECARQTFHELDMLHDVDAKFYGDGLVQAMAKDYVRNPLKKQAMIAFNSPATISAEYAELNRKLHTERLDYGVGGGRHKDVVLKLARSLNTNSILDYGCGKGYLAKELPFPIWEYDPAVRGKDHAPPRADLTICTDVLEHIEPDKLDLVLDDLRRVTGKVGYFVVHTGPSSKVLEDGRNSHLIQKDKDWWKSKLEKYFTLPRNGVMGKEPLAVFVVGPKKISIKRKAA